MSAIPYTTFQKDFTIGRTIGKGCSSQVKEVYNAKQNITYALKIMKCQNSDKMAEALNQMETIVAIDDDAMPKIYYYYIRQIPMINGIKSKFMKQMGFIMELCQGDLNSQIQNIKANQRLPYTTSEIVSFIHTFIRLFSKMQKKNYMHRDIKPENILYKKEEDKTIYKLADFGFAIKLNTYSASTISGIHYLMKGTQQYVSPRVLKKFKNTKLIIAGNNFKDDMYSLGITVIEMIFLEVKPMNGKVYIDIQSVHGKYVRKLIQLMTQHQEENRPDFCQMQNLIQNQRQNKRSQQEKFRSYYKKINRYYNSLQQTNIRQNTGISHKYKCQNQTTNIQTKSNCNIFYPIQQGGKTKKKIDIGYCQDAQMQTQDPDESQSYHVNPALHLKNSFKKIHLDETVYNEDHYHSDIRLNSIDVVNKRIQTLKVQKIELQNQQIYCVKICQDMILFGLTDFIGVAFTQSPKKYCKVQIQLPESIFFKKSPFIVTGIKVQNNTIVFFGTSKILLTIQTEKFRNTVHQFMKKLEEQHSFQIELLNKKSIFNSSYKRNYQIKDNILKRMPFQIYNCRQTVSCVDFVNIKKALPYDQINQCQSSEYFIVMGHYSGQISQCGQMNLIKMDDSPITQIKVHNQYLYLSSAKGKLKKYLLQNLRTYQNSQNVQTKVQCYNYHYPVVSFSFINQKLKSKSFKKNGVKKGNPFIKLITFDGYLHILTQKLTLIQWIMIADSGVFAISQINCIWESQYINQQNQEEIIETNIFQTQNKITYILNINGSIFDQQGSLVVKSQLSTSNCFDLTNQLVVCGSFQGILAIIKPQIKVYNQNQFSNLKRQSDQ